MSEKSIIAIVSITIPTLAGFYVGMPYIGSLIGNIVYLLSVLFLIAFVAVNVFYRQKIEDLSKGKLYFTCIAYLSSIPLIYLINSLKPSSIFLICLFFLYFFLAFIWAFIAEKRRLTNVCIVLFILCLLPLIFGFYVHWIHEDPICDEIKHLENQKEQYKNHFDDLNYGILTQHRTDSAKNDIRELEEDIEKTKECYLVADFSGAWKKIEAANESNNNLKRTFELLHPKKVLYDELRELDEELVQLNSRAYNVKDLVDPEDVYRVERILSDINATKNKTDEAWNLYRNGRYEESYEFIVQINADIYDIKERIDRIEILQTPLLTTGIGFGAIFLIALLVVAFLLLLAVEYLLSKRR